MTNPITTHPGGSEPPADGPEGTPEGNDTGELQGEPQKGNREARYRVERNEARAERDALAQRVERMQTKDLERIAGEAMSNPADLLTLTGKPLSEFLDDDGELDEELVTEAANELLSSRPGLRRQSPAFDPSQGHGGSPGKPKAPSWGELLTN